MTNFSDLINGDTPTLVDFSAEWCGPCKMMKPILEEVKAVVGDKVRIVKVDVDKNPVAASAFQVQSVPTLALFRAGQLIWRRSGVIPLAELKQILFTHAV